MSVRWKIDECCVYHDRLLLRGWCFSAPSPIVTVAAVFASAAGPVAVSLASHDRPSPDVAATEHPSATHARFDEFVTAQPEILGHDFTLRFTLADGSVEQSTSAVHSALASDPFFAGFDRFLAHLGHTRSGTALLIGAQACSRRREIPEHLDCIGFNLQPGADVDVVGDAHRLAAAFDSQRFVAAMSFSVFEHLAMPWKVALELNHVLAPDGLVFTSTHQTWPLHGKPWDCWRFSRHSWQTLFNAATGFEIIETASGDPAHVHAGHTNPVTRGLADSRDAHLGSCSLVRKISSSSLRWPAPA